MSEISTVDASFAEDVGAYAAAGFDAIGIWEFKLPEDDDANRARLRGNGLAVANCVPAVPSILQLRIPGMEGPADPEERIEAICASIHRLSVYEPESVLFLSGPTGDLSDAEAYSVLAAGAARIAAAARECDVRVGLEPIHPSQRDSAGFVTSLVEAAACLDGLGLQDVGIMLDTYHAWDDPVACGWIEANATRISGVHVCDWPPDSGRHDRVLPGEGGSRTQALVESLRVAGWDGSLDVEIFSDPARFWGLRVDEAARRGYAAAVTLL